MSKHIRFFLPGENNCPINPKYFIVLNVRIEPVRVCLYDQILGPKDSNKNQIELQVYLEIKADTNYRKNRKYRKYRKKKKWHEQVLNLKISVKLLLTWREELFDRSRIPYCIECSRSKRVNVSCGTFKFLLTCWISPDYCIECSWSSRCEYSDEESWHIVGCLNTLRYSWLWYFPEAAYLSVSAV